MDISPDKQNIDAVFSNTTYYIDFYQREYKWTEEPVKRLLDDVFYKFNEAYEKHKDLPPSREVVEGKYPWYYLNTYITNKVEGRVFIVDGQQRLTTLSLIITKLYHLTKSENSELVDWLKNKILGQSGFEKEFWMNHEKHKSTQQALFEGKSEEADTSTGITARNMVQNYQIISKYLDKELKGKHRLESFILYFLYRLVLINLSVEQTDVPMVFEVINDRGVKLKPFEILKGKLLGQIDKTILDKKNYNEVWEKRVREINAYGEDQTDEFFRAYLKAKYSNSKKDGQAFDGDYHRIMFSSAFQDKLKLDRNQSGVIEFLDGHFRYYSHLYENALSAYNSEEDSGFSFNRLLSLDGAFFLLLSCCRENDPEEAKKIEAIPLELDRLYSLLQLQNAYDSNSFQEILYRISGEIRECHFDEIRPAFDHHLTEELKKQRMTDAEEPFRYTFFKQTGINLPPRFKRYFFARVEEFIAQNTNNKMKQNISDLVSKTGAKTGFHIEHILAHNEENLSLFDRDDERFDQERNRLGAILLLKGKDNISSNNESYADKLKSYANTLYWNETLREDSYKSKLDMNSLIKEYEIDLKPVPVFGPEQIEERQQILFKIASNIWG